MNYSSDIKIYGASLSLGENLREVCPACGGGTSKEKSLSITLGEDGKLRWQCFRAKCSMSEGASGVAGIRMDDRNPEVKRRKTFDGETHKLREIDRQWIEMNWGLTDPAHWYYTPEMGGRIAMSVRGPNYLHRGWVLRSIRGNARCKALTYLNDGQLGLSWYKTTPKAPTILVEDIPSALRASKILNAVSLLGTSIGIDKAIEISNNVDGPIYLALDQDATDLAFKYAKRYALLWDGCEVIPLKKDLKDMTEDELCSLLAY